jgi:hypothetical protein
MFIGRKQIEKKHLSIVWVISYEGRWMTLRIELRTQSTEPIALQEDSQGIRISLFRKLAICVGVSCILEKASDSCVSVFCHLLVTLCLLHYYMLALWNPKVFRLKRITPNLSHLYPKVITMLMKLGLWV